MESIKVYISGEDPVTKAVIRRLMGYVSERFQVIMEIPARGGEIKKKIPQCNKLAESYPVIMLLDVDDGCAPALKRELLGGLEQSDRFLMNIAVDEAEAWIMADREGFAKYFSIDIDEIPLSASLKMGGMKKVVEMDFPMKSSMVLTHVIAPKSKNKEFVKQVAVLDSKGKCKGKEYNNAIVPFIEKAWNVDHAMENSDSLQRMVRRLKVLHQSYGIHSA